MNHYLLTESASDDLRDIVEYLAGQAGEDTASRIEDELFAKFTSLALHLGQGHLRSDLTSLRLYFFTVDPYIIVY